MNSVMESTEEALRTGGYDSLSIRRVGNACYLVVCLQHSTRVLSRKDGTALTFRHAWQLPEWLSATCGIDARDVGVEKLR